MNIVYILCSQPLSLSLITCVLAHSQAFDITHAAQHGLVETYAAKSILRNTETSSVRVSKAQFNRWMDRVLDEQERRSSALDGAQEMHSVRD